MLKEIFSEEIIASYCKKKEINQFPIKDIIIENSITNLKTYIKSWQLKNILFVADENTKDILDHLIENLDRKFSSYILPKNCKPSIENVEQIRSVSKEYDFLFAVGSGVINDITKFASFLSNKKYGLFITAPSVNGFTSQVASIIFGNYKESVHAHLPQYIIIDNDILCNAPLRLIQSGFGDSMAYYTSRVDWLLSHLLLKTDFEEKPFIWLAEFQSQLFRDSSKILARDPEYIFLLIKNLLISGLGMSYVGNSKPASQGEHMLAHTINYKNDSNLLHGEEIAITSSFMVKLQENIISLKQTPSVVLAYDYEQMIENFFGKDIDIIQQYKNKIEEISQLEFSNIIIQNLKQYIVNSQDFHNSLQNANLPINCVEAGWCSQEFFTRATKFAKFYRNRFTFLDFC